MTSYLIKDTSKEERERIVAESIGNINGSCDTRKAERFFKERGIKFQSIDLKEKGLSRGEFTSVMQAVGGVDAMIDPECKDKDLLALVTYISGKNQNPFKIDFNCLTKIEQTKDYDSKTTQYTDRISVWLCPHS